MAIYALGYSSSPFPFFFRYFFSITVIYNSDVEMSTYNLFRVLDPVLDVGNVVILVHVLPR